MLLISNKYQVLGFYLTTYVLILISKSKRSLQIYMCTGNSHGISVGFFL